MIEKIAQDKPSVCLYVCVCVCVERERQRERTRSLSQILFEINLFIAVRFVYGFFCVSVGNPAGAYTEVRPFKFLNTFDFLMSREHSLSIWLQIC